MSQSKKSHPPLHQPHDKLMFSALRQKAVAKGLFYHQLPEALLSLADFSRMKLRNTKFVTPQYQAFEADILYEIPLADRTGLFLLHCELQSTVDSMIALRVWQYILLLLMEWHDDHPGEPLPVVYPIIVYTGAAGYHASTEFFDLFGNQKALAKSYLFNEITVVDVCRLEDSDIRKHDLFGLTEFAFKYKETREFGHFMDEFLSWMNDLSDTINKDYAKMLLKYVMNVYREADTQTFVDKAQHHLSTALGEEAMTIAQQLRQEGMQEGTQAMALRLVMEDGMPVERAANLANLSVESLQAIIDSKKRH